ncbi:MAG: hypothetical protein PHP20_00040 [Firmicutes bacterium]|nr:hypothetical protein [Bacillota bacterium]MDD4336827.1 hypothetical protein [Bacillota bacterium]MDD4791447.1 hypothetical protein [Bacillota bacterium]
MSPGNAIEIMSPDAFMKVDCSIYDVWNDVYGASDTGGTAVADMVRKQLYVRRRHDDFLKKHSVELGVTEAKIVRDALESYTAYSGSTRHDSSAWAAQEAFIDELVSAAQSRVSSGRTWQRDDLHER